jgi:hypothetical protein
MIKMEPKCNPVSLKKGIYIMISVLFLLSCHSDKQISLNGFDESAWKNDSLGCKGVRTSLAKMLDSNSNILIGRSSAELKTFLGQPNLVYEHNGRTMYSYFVLPGRQCVIKNWREKHFTETMKIIFIISEDKVQGTSGIVYP